MDKICKSCGVRKLLTDFHRRTLSPDGHQSRCKRCNSKQRNEYYKTARGRDNNRGSDKKWAFTTRRKVYDYLLIHPCACGESDPVVLEFDHRNKDEKSFNISSKIGVFSLEKIMAEIEKCDVLCANCHKRRTAEQFGWSKLLWQNEVH